MTQPSSPNSPPSNSPRRPLRSPVSDDDSNRSWLTGPWPIMLIAMLLLSIWLWKQSPSSKGETVDYSFVWSEIEKGNVVSAEFHGERLTGKWKEIPDDPKDKKEPKAKLKSLEFNSVLPYREDHELKALLNEKKVPYGAEPQDPGLATAVLLWLLGPLLLIGFLWMMMRRTSDPLSSGMLGSFIRSPAKRFKPSDHATTFDDVAAMEQAKGELQEIVEFLKTPAKFQRLGAQIPKGVLLMGPPGTGKTLLARATAGEAGVPFFTINGSEFIQMFVGVGASRVRDMFRTAKENAPCILFIDEIDAVGRIRGAGMGGGHDEREQTLNQILSEMDGFQQTEAVIVVAATNRPDVLDPALLRPGRFDRHVTVDRPNRPGRAAILKVHSRKVPLADDVDFDKIAGGTIGFSGAELKNLVNEAALNAAREGRDSVTAEDFDFARDKVLMGPRREEVLSLLEREMTACHEAGHALLAWFLPDVDRVHKVTIIPRGRALGVTQLMPTEERYNIGERRLHSQLAFMLGGRAAEKLVFNEYSAGAEDDLKRATQTARRMVSRWGMSDIIGPVAYRDGEEHPFLGKEYHEQREYSEETAREIDTEVQRFLHRADQQAQQILTDRRDKLEALTKALVAEESLSEDEMIKVLGKPVPRSDAVLDTPDPAAP